jgi:hypothetical protein
MNNNKTYRLIPLTRGLFAIVDCVDYEQDAAIAYDDMATELFGQFARLNYHHRPEIAKLMS